MNDLLLNLNTPVPNRFDINKKKHVRFVYRKLDNLLLIDCTLLKVNLKNNVARKFIYKEIPTSFTLTFDKFNLVHVSATYGFSILTYPVSSIELFTGPNWKNIKSLKRQIEQETQPRL